MAPFSLRWGIIFTGVIATQFSEDLLVDPATRRVDDVWHKIAAIGSRSTKAAQDFIQRVKTSSGACSWGIEKGLLEECKAYGSYEEVFNDPFSCSENVGAVYIGTPHTFHHANAEAALLGGQHVCCEKPFTFDIEELDELFAITTERNLFLKE